MMACVVPAPKDAMLVELLHMTAYVHGLIPNADFVFARIRKHGDVQTVLLSSITLNVIRTCYFYVVLPGP